MGTKKIHPIYILLTVEEQAALATALQNLSLRFVGASRPSALGLGQLAQALMLLETQSGTDKPAWRSGRSGQDALMASLLFIPMSDCLWRVDRMVDRLDREIESYQRAFDQIHSQFERLQRMMGTIMEVLERMQTHRQDDHVHTEVRGQGREIRPLRCECGRLVGGAGGIEEKEENQKEGQEQDEVEDRADE
jgi:hypothetical protein